MSEKSTYGIIGYPVEHSLSPVMHNTAFNALKVNAVYKLFPVPEAELEDFFEKLREKNSPIFGLNVTVPYKEKACGYMDLLSPFAERVKAVNTVVIGRDRKLTGYNTDGPGFLSHLAELKMDVRGKRITILGAGGTTRAILAALCLLPEKPNSIRIYNRTPQHVTAMLDDLRQRMDVSSVQVVGGIDDLNVELADLLINTTPVGLKASDPCLLEEDVFHSDMMVYDVIYNPRETELLRRARLSGAKTANGLGMLFYQGVLAFQHWAEVQLSKEIKEKMRHALETAIPGGV